MPKERSLKNYRGGYLQQGAVMGMTHFAKTLTADNQAVNPNKGSLLFLGSDNTTATNRTFTLLDGTWKGQRFTMNFNVGSSYTCDLQSTGNVTLVEAWQPTQYEVLELMWDGVEWCEIARSVTGIVTGSIVNADINASAAIAYSKLNLSSSILSTDLSLTDSAMKMARYTVAYTDLNTAGDGVPHVAGVTIPDNSVIFQVIIDVTTTFVGDGDDSSLISMGIEDQDNDTVVAVAIKTATDWDIGIKPGVQVGTAATMIKTTAARQLATTVDYATTDTTLSAGAMDVYVFYTVSST